MTKGYLYQKNPLRSRGYKWSKTTPYTPGERKILYGPSHHMAPLRYHKGHYPDGILYLPGEIRQAYMIMIAEVLADMAKRDYRRKHEIAKWKKAYKIWKETTW